MLREIKFRVWDGENMFLSPTEIGHLGSWFDAHYPGSLAKPELKSLMQFTGLKDKKRTKEFPNGQDIYEGDVWKYTSTELVNISTGKKSKHNGFRIGTIEFLGGKFVEIIRLQENSFFGELPNIGNIYVKKNIAEHIEIIGNIYENPELLSKEVPNA